MGKGQTSPGGNTAETLRRDDGPVLRGFTIGITADRRWEEQGSLFERRGASVIHGPAIRTRPLGSEARLRAATEAVISRPPDALVANTGIGMRSWFGAAESWGLGADLLAALGATRIYARGPKASGAVHAAGLEVVARAASERLSEAVELALRDLRTGAVVAVQADGSGETPASERLAGAGATVVEVPVYDWTLPEDRRPAIRLAEATVAGRVHAVTFTAAPAVRNWLAIAAEADLHEPLRRALVEGGVVVGCVGPVCAEAAVAAGLHSEHLVVPPAARLGPLVRAVTDRLIERTVVGRLEGAEIALTGTVATIAGQAFELTETEARLLGALAAHPGIVVSKADLLRTVWGDEAADAHVVEVTVARLRRRLGPYGASLASVHRRGYVLRR